MIRSSYNLHLTLCAYTQMAGGGRVLRGVVWCVRGAWCVVRGAWCVCVCVYIIFETFVDFLCFEWQ